MRLIIMLFLPFTVLAQLPLNNTSLARYRAQAKNVTIIRDTWGVPHIYGKTDADAVFGLLYAQCEENFPGVERNYLEMLGRLSEVDGISSVFSDLKMRLIYDSSAAIRDYDNSPVWLKKLLWAFADGVNFYLLTHPEVKPRVLNEFKPWYPLMFTDGSISATQDGGLTNTDMLNLYGEDFETSWVPAPKTLPAAEIEPGGSNGFALAPQKTRNKHAILYINPHVTFYFRSEVQMTSAEGLNVYGAVTWGQFFVYQGFNQHCGWMHTSSYADVADLYEVKIANRDSALFYRYDGKYLPVQNRKIIIAYKTKDGNATKTFDTYATIHGPVMGSRNGKWLSLKENNRSLKALVQSWQRTKATGFNEFRKTMQLCSNNSNNTVFADDHGNIAYWHGNFMPKRNPAFDWNLPVDGATSATAWKGIHSLEEIVHVYNPASGWIENCNSTPFTVSGESSPKKDDFPAYMAPDGQNPRAINAIRLLSSAKDMTINKMITQVGYNHYLSAFEILLPGLFQSYDDLKTADPLKDGLSEPVHLLRSWDKNSSAASIACTLAVEWAYRLAQILPAPATGQEASDGIGHLHRMEAVDAADKLKALAQTIKDLEKRFGTWKIPWGEINRYQRLASGKHFNDDAPSLPVGLAAATWGSIPSFASRRMDSTNKRYGVSGNSFVACVEFGKKVRAKSIITGGQSFDPWSKHFTDQAQSYIDGNFKDVWFYKDDVMRHVEKMYHPGAGR